MALKLLQPGLRPMGQFDCDDAITKANITGGELQNYRDPFRVLAIITLQTLDKQAQT